MDGFDFNIQNYSLSEMEDLLGLAAKKGKGYTPGDVASCKQRLVLKLASSGKQDKKMVDFLNAVHKCILSKLDNGRGNAQENRFYSPVTSLKQNTIIPGTKADGHFVIPDPYRMYVPVHAVQIDDAAEIIIKRDAKFLNVDGAKEAALPVQLDAGRFVNVLQEADVDSCNNVFNCKRFREHGGVIIVDAVIVIVDGNKNVVCRSNGDERF